jgi:S-adenosylmethionine synthetase
VAHPVSIYVHTFGTGAVDDSLLSKAVGTVFDLRPAAIIKRLDLRRPIFRRLSAYGHMGREELGVSWEKTDMTGELLQALESLKK